MRFTLMLWRAACAGLVIGLSWAPAAAQDTREAAIAAEQAEKTKHLAPYVPRTGERLIDQIESGAWFNPANMHGFYPMFGSVYPGGGFTFGGGLRKYVGYASYVDLHGLYSIAGYKLVELTAASPNHLGGRLDVAMRAGWRDVTQVGYYGLGIESDQDARANFRLNQAYVEGETVIRPTRRTFLRGGVGYEDYTEKEGLGSFPSIEDLYNPTTAPNLGENPSYVHLHGGAGLNWLKSPGYSRSGGFYRYTYHHYVPSRGAEGDAFGIGRSEIVQHIPILRETWVLSLRGRTESVVGSESDAPYFLLPWLGSGSTLRGYKTGRFRDRHALLLSAEWRWIPNRLGLDMALFADAGKVAPRASDLDFTDLKTDYGIGIRFHAPTVTVFRVDVARGSEGWRLVVASSSPF